MRMEHTKDMQYNKSTLFRRQINACCNSKISHLGDTVWAYTFKFKFKKDVGFYRAKIDITWKTDLHDE